jgi:hypothetical protein
MELNPSLTSIWRCEGHFKEFAGSGAPNLAYQVYRFVSLCNRFVMHEKNLLVRFVQNF